MGLHVNSNLALEIAVDIAPPLAAKHDPRAELAAQFVPAGARVLDLSATKTLERYLPNGCIYQGLARPRRKSEPRDIAGDDFPTKAALNADVIVMLGTLEPVADLESLFTHLRFCKRDIILSYGAADLNGGAANRLGFCELTMLFDRYGFRIACTAPVSAREQLMRLTPAERLTPPAPVSVAVVSNGESGDFGDRLGLAMLHGLLPGEAEVHHLTFRTLGAARGAYDLVVLGTGNSLYPPLIGDGLIDIVSRAKASIGIFGTQHRELVSRSGLERLIDRLDTWYARNEDDVLMYGRGRPNVVHLGDWLIDRFSMVRPTADEPLEIGSEIEPDVPLESAIATIQRHRQVYTAQPQALLCALTAADMVAYADAPAARTPASGACRSMLTDIFGRSYPEKKFFLVERDAVARYKARVHANVAELRQRVETLLRNVAAAG